MADVGTLFAGIGFIIILGFIGNYFFRKTRIPDVVWLMALGLLLGPVLNLIDASLFIPYSSYVAAVALMIILFEGGLNTDFYLLVKQSPRSFTAAIGCVAFSMLAVAPIMQYFFGWPPLYGLLLGAMIGGSSSPIVMSITAGLSLSKKVKTILNLESTLSDALCIVVAIVLIQMITLGAEYPLDLAAHNIAASFSIGAMVGGVVGVLWLLVLKRIKGKPFEYMLTLAVLFVVYAAIEKMMASGAIGALAFGVVLGNSKFFSRFIDEEEKIVVNRSVRKFHQEVSFLVRTFFFVYLGLLVTIGNYWLIALGIGITIALLLVRLLAIRISTFRSDITNKEKSKMSVIMPRGLAAAVLAQFPLAYGLLHANIFNDIIFVVIISSIAICSAGLVALKR